MKFKKQLCFYTVVIIISAIVCFFEFKKPFAGSLINSVFPCKQEITMSAPCYMGYDIAAMLIFSVILVVLFFVTFIKIIKHFDKSSFRLSR